tara:strand:+ start:751 stop:1020 length:270 start_codon:yes stop_codon:yes gene_type:complete
MAFERYDFLGSNINSKIYSEVRKNNISFKTVLTNSTKRLDHYSLETYGDSSYWWVIAAASGIGWWLQVPPGVILYIPTDLNQIKNLTSR